MMTNIEILIGSVPDREKLVAMLFYGSVQWAEISQDRGELILELYEHPTGQSWNLKFDEVIQALLEAKARLAGRVEK